MITRGSNCNSETDLLYDFEQLKLISKTQFCYLSIRDTNNPYYIGFSGHLSEIIEGSTLHGF